MNKISKISEVENNIKELKEENEKIILAGGSFDILHAGHVEFLEKSKNLGGKLVVLLESDESIRRTKGEKRPVNNQAERAIILSHLDMVDLVVLLPLFADKDYDSLVKKINPDIISIVKTDLKKERKQKQAEMTGAKLIEVMNNRTGYSTSNIFNKLRTK